MKQGYYSLILHAHLPYVRHRKCGRLEERWLFEAMTETYIPLLWNLENQNENKMWTISFSPPLMEMLSDPLIQRRYLQYVERTQELLTKESNRSDLANEKLERLIAFYTIRYQHIIDTFNKWQQNVLNGFRYYEELGKISCITSSATHAFLPYLQTKEGLRAQIVYGIQCFEKHFGKRPKGFWLPECGFTPGIDRILHEEKIRFVVVDEQTILTSDPKPSKGIGAPVYSPHGIALFPRNSTLSSLVWSSVIGYPGDFDYREFYRDIGYDREWEYIESFVHPEGIRVDTGLKYYRITGNTEEKALYDPNIAEVKAAKHATHFIGEVKRQINCYGDQSYPPFLALTAFDAELFGHWWFEGPSYLAYLLEEGRNEIEFITPEEYLDRHYRDLETVHACFSTWGRNGYGEVWLNERNCWMYQDLHDIEKDVIRIIGEFKNPTELEERAIKQLIREWLLASSSDWAFIISEDTSTQYAVDRFNEHISRYKSIRSDLFSERLTHETVTTYEAEYPFLKDLTISPLLSSHDAYLQQKKKKVKNGLQVLMLSWEFPPMTVGGLARHVYDLSKALVKEGHEVHVLTSVVEGYPDYEINEGVHVHRVTGLMPKAEQFFHWVGSLNLAMADHGRELAKSISFDVIHAHDWLVSVAAKGLKHMLKLPLIATIHATEHGRNDGIRTPLQYEINQKEWELTYEADKVIVCSEYMKKEVIDIFSLPYEKISVFPNGVDPKMVSENTEPVEVLNGKKIIVFSVGRIVKEKGFETIIESAPAILAKHPNVTFIIAGKGPMLETYRNMVKERQLESHIQFTGFISDEDRNSLLKRCDMAVFPSLYEPFGIVALESMIAGKPTIVCNTGGLGDIIIHGKTGLKMIPGDATSLAKQINTLINKQQLARLLAQNGKHVAETVFSWEKIAYDTSQLFKECLNKSKIVGSV